MAEGQNRQLWNHTSHLLAPLWTAVLKPRRAFEARDWNPLMQDKPPEPRKPQKADKATVHLVRDAFMAGKG